jgi:transcriptional regulator with XRE-family HTH domain
LNPVPVVAYARVSSEPPEGRGGAVVVSTNPTFARRLRELRVAAGLSQYELAKRAGLTSQAINRLEGREGRDPSWSTVQRLARALGLPVGAFDVEEYPVPPQPAEEPPPPTPRPIGKRK